MIVEDKPGRITLTEAEKSILLLHPKFLLPDDLSEEEIEVELNLLGCKLRWSIQKDLDEELAPEDQIEVTEEEKIRIAENEEESRMIYDP